VVAATGEEALALAQGDEFRVVITELKLVGMGGLALLQRLSPLLPRAWFPVLTGTGCVNTRGLLIEHDASDAMLFETELRLRHPGEVAVTVAPDMASAEAALERETFDVISLDLGLPDARWLDGCANRGQDSLQVTPLLGAADAAMYVSKKQSRSGYHIHGADLSRFTLAFLEQTCFFRDV
jgi:DNA-binding response OmpR family regulator